MGGGGIFLVQVMEHILGKEKGKADRIIVITDEQDCDSKRKPSEAMPFGDFNYVINVSSDRNGVGYGAFTHIDGFSEYTLEYIQKFEALASE